MYVYMNFGEHVSLWKIWTKGGVGVGICWSGRGTFSTHHSTWVFLGAPLLSGRDTIFHCPLPFYLHTFPSPHLTSPYLHFAGRSTLHFLPPPLHSSHLVCLYHPKTFALQPYLHHTPWHATHPLPLPALPCSTSLPFLPCLLLYCALPCLAIFMLGVSVSCHVPSCVFLVLLCCCFFTWVFWWWLVLFSFFALGLFFTLSCKNNPCLSCFGAASFSQASDNNNSHLCFVFNTFRLFSPHLLGILCVCLG